MVVLVLPLEECLSPSLSPGLLNSQRTAGLGAACTHLVSFPLQLGTCPDLVPGTHTVYDLLLNYFIYLFYIFILEIADSYMVVAKDIWEAVVTLSLTTKRKKKKVI